MVEETATDGRRIAELLASELTGIAIGPLSEVAIVDANPDATPAADPPVAYRIEYHGDRLGEVRLQPSAAVIALAEEWPADAPVAGEGLSLEGSRTLAITRGAAVKRALDALLVTLRAR